MKIVFAVSMLVLWLMMAPPPTDLDRDGLLDNWERTECARAVGDGQACDPLRQDLVLVVCVRPGMTRSQVEPTLEQLRRFFARLPGRNPDDSIGINLITVWGNPLPLSDHGTAYEFVYERGMPHAWRGLGHGVLIGPEISGGGRTSRRDWSGVSNNWHSIVHELGHQLGLDHEPLGSNGQSPLYTSLMNYDYNYSFNGNPDAVHFSEGKFASIGMNESSLSEELPFPLAELHFLSQVPYHFLLRAAGPRVTQVDWNRNGVFEHGRVRADVNDGYGVGVHDEHRLGKTAGSPTLVVSNGRLTAIFPDFRSPSDYARHVAETLSPEATGRIVARAYAGNAWQRIFAGVSGWTTWTERAVLTNHAAGDPHAAFAFRHLIIAFPIVNSYVVQLHDPSHPFVRRAIYAALDDVAQGEQRHPVLVATSAPEQVWLFLWNATTGGVTYRRVAVETGMTRRVRLGPVHRLEIGTATGSTPLTSQYPIHATYDPTIERIVLITSEREREADGRLRMHIIGRRSGEVWSLESSRWTMGEGGYSRSRARPWVLRTPSPEGVVGGYLIYHKGDVTPVNLHATTWLSRTIPDRSSWDGWRTSMMGNEWLTTRSAPAAVAFDDDIAYAVRWFGHELDHELLVNLRSSGVQDGIVADHDDVGFIRARGLRQSLGR